MFACVVHAIVVVVEHSFHRHPRDEGRVITVVSEVSYGVQLTLNGVIRGVISITCNITEQSITKCN